MTHPLLARVRSAGFEPLGGLAPEVGDGVPEGVRYLLVIGNAGGAMFARFAAEADPRRDQLDDWCRDRIGALGRSLAAEPVYPFDQPPPPFLRWARKAGCGHVSPLGLNIHPRFGLWHAYRAALLFGVDPGLPAFAAGPHPCESCAAKPCLDACPVGAFTGTDYRISDCARHLRAPEGRSCMSHGCLARHACPVGRDSAHAPDQAGFHMRAFLAARPP